MNRIQQIEPITQIQKRPAELLAKLAAGPIVLAQRSRPAAVLVSVEEWDRISDELNRLRLGSESRRIAAENDAGDTWVSSTEMRERMAKHGVVG